MEQLKIKGNVWRPAKWYGTLDECYVVFDVMSAVGGVVNEVRKGRATSTGLLRTGIGGTRVIVDLRTMDIKLDKGTK